MQTNKIPVGIAGIAKLMKLAVEEVRVWKHYDSVRGLFKDYNFGVLNKTKLFERLDEISVKCINDKEYHYSTGIDNAKATINAVY